MFRTGTGAEKVGPIVATVRTTYKRKDGKWAWRLKASNGDVIATDGSQGYENEADAASMADRVIAGEFKDAEKKVEVDSDSLKP